MKSNYNEIFNIKTFKSKISDFLTLHENILTF